MDVLPYQFIFYRFSYSIVSTLLKIILKTLLKKRFLQNLFFSDNNLRLKLVENNNKK